MPTLSGLALPEADKLEAQKTLEQVINLLTGLIGGKTLPVKGDGLGVPASPGVGLPELDSLELEATIKAVINILTGLLG